MAAVGADKGDELGVGKVSVYQEVDQEHAASVLEVAAPLPSPARLMGIVPNPTNASTCIEFELAVPDFLELAVYNAKGARVCTLRSQLVRAGRHSVVWHGLDESGKAVSSGVYVIRLVAGGYCDTRRVTLVR